MRVPWLMLMAATSLLASCALTRTGLLEEDEGPGASDGPSGAGGSSVGASGPGGEGPGGDVSGGGAPGGSSPGGGPGGSGPGGGSVCGNGDVCLRAASGGTLVRDPMGAGCPSGYEQSLALYDGTDPGCPACSCGAPMGGGCSSYSVTRYYEFDCTQKIDGPTTVAPNSCQDVTASSSEQAGSYHVIPEVDQGSCTASNDPPQLVDEETVCVLSSPSPGDCGAGEICVPEAPGTKACVVLAGDVACPTAYPDKRLRYGSFVDSRSCSCNCSTPTGGVCTNGSLVLHNGSDCTGASASGNVGPCLSAAQFLSHDSYEITPATFQSGSCTPMDASTGEVSFSDLQSLCCAQ